MKTFSLHELRKELKLLPAKDLLDICVSLAKYRKDNKEFLSYLLVESFDKGGFVKEVKQELDEHFLALDPGSNPYYIKKSLRKLLRLLARYSKFINDKAVTAELLIYFLQKISSGGYPVKKSELIKNIYEQQHKKIGVLIESIHEDLQQDYKRELQELSL